MPAAARSRGPTSPARRRSLPAAPHVRASASCSREPRARPASAAGSGSHDEPGPAVGDDLERPAGVGRRHDRLLGQERLVRAPSRSPRRRARSRRRGSARRGRRARRRRHAAGEGRRGRRGRAGARAPRAARGPGPSPATTPRSAASAASASSSRSTRFARSSRPTERTKSPYASQRYASACGGCGSTSAAMPGRALEPAGDVRARSRTTFRASPSATAVEALHLRGAARGPRADSRELAELGAVELVRLAELVQRARRPCCGWRTQYDGNFVATTRSIAPAVRLLEVEQPPEERLRQHALARVPLERHRHERPPRGRARAAPRRASSAKISAPPRANGTCGRQTAILIVRATIA